ncbi:MAG: hypothetical protein KBD63_00105 [Bacteriovoracaceae bacterium]|nr:hypothetical protein [Bacteriovoracaceae bacterium]
MNKNTILVLDGAFPEDEDFYLLGGIGAVIVSKETQTLGHMEGVFSTFGIPCFYLANAFNNELLIKLEASKGTHYLKVDGLQVLIERDLSSLEITKHLQEKSKPHIPSRAIDLGQVHPIGLNNRTTTLSSQYGMKLVELHLVNTTLNSHSEIPIVGLPFGFVHRYFQIGVIFDSDANLLDFINQQLENIEKGHNLKTSLHNIGDAIAEAFLLPNYSIPEIPQFNIDPKYQEIIQIAIKQIGRLLLEEFEQNRRERIRNILISTKLEINQHSISGLNFPPYESLSSTLSLEKFIEQKLENIKQGRNIEYNLASIRFAIRNTIMPKDLQQELYKSFRMNSIDLSQKIIFRSSSLYGDGLDGSYESVLVDLHSSSSIELKMSQLAIGLNDVLRSFYSVKAYLLRQRYGLKEGQDAVTAFVHNFIEGTHGLANLSFEASETIVEFTTAPKGGSATAPNGGKFSRIRLVKDDEGKMFLIHDGKRYESSPLISEYAPLFKMMESVALKKGSGKFTFEYVFNEKNKPQIIDMKDRGGTKEIQSDNTSPPTTDFFAQLIQRLKVHQIYDLVDYLDNNELYKAFNKEFYNEYYRPMEEVSGNPNIFNVYPAFFIINIDGIPYVFILFSQSFSHNNLSSILSSFLEEAKKSGEIRKYEFLFYDALDLAYSKSGSKITINKIILSELFRYSYVDTNGKDYRHLFPYHNILEVIETALNIFPQVFSRSPNIIFDPSYTEFNVKVSHLYDDDYRYGSSYQDFINNLDFIKENNEIRYFILANQIVSDITRITRSTENEIMVDDLKGLKNLKRIADFYFDGNVAKAKYFIFAEITYFTAQQKINSLPNHNRSISWEDLRWGEKPSISNFNRENFKERINLAKKIKKLQKKGFPVTYNWDQTGLSTKALIDLQQRFNALTATLPSHYLSQLTDRSLFVSDFWSLDKVIALLDVMTHKNKLNSLKEMGFNRTQIDRINTIFNAKENSGASFSDCFAAFIDDIK